jgi:2',3'-cyclic-nucleotide 2'-phosphodiesterase (5'-nucleotidase family)
MKKKIFLYIFLMGFIEISLAQDIIINFKDYKIDNSQTVDSTYIQLLAPYADSIHHSMQKVIGFSLYGMTKKQPESGLGNFMADGMKLMAEKKFNRIIDAAFVNYGGIRNYIPKGDVTIGAIFELMPFDNIIVLQEINGKMLQQFLDKTAEKGGWPVSGITLSIKNKKAVNVLINNKPLDENATYIIANSDYIANGGDDCFMLKKMKQLSVGYLFRDALIEYVMLLTQQSKSIDTKTENRIIYAN